MNDIIHRTLHLQGPVHIPQADFELFTFQKTSKGRLGFFHTPGQGNYRNFPVAVHQSLYKQGSDQAGGTGDENGAAVTQAVGDTAADHRLNILLKNFISHFFYAVHSHPPL